MYKSTMLAYSVDHIIVKLMKNKLMRRPNAKSVRKKQDTKTHGLFHTFEFDST